MTVSERMATDFFIEFGLFTDFPITVGGHLQARVRAITIRSPS
jgi:hypothetical protein